MSFRIIPSDAEEVRYAVVMDGQAEPTVDQIFEGGGISADATVAKSYTAGDLEPNTSYNIIAAARNAAGCSEPAKITMKTAEPGVPASVSLEPGEATIQSITFRLSPLNATKAAYVCLAEGETLPSAESILAEGDPAAAAAAGDYTVENLEPNTTYRIAAAAEGRTGLSAVVHIDMRTAIPAPTVSLEAGEAAVDALEFTLTSADAGRLHLREVGRDGACSRRHPLLRSRGGSRESRFLQDPRSGAGYRIHNRGRSVGSGRRKSYDLRTAYDEDFEACPRGAARR